MSRQVHCVKLKKEAPGLTTPPFSGPLGEQIFAQVSEEAWKEWADDMMIKVINEYRLNMVDPKDYEKLLDQMRSFLNLSADGQVLEVGNADRGRP